MSSVENRDNEEQTSSQTTNTPPNHSLDSDSIINLNLAHSRPHQLSLTHTSLSAIASPDPNDLSLLNDLNEHSFADFESESHFYHKKYYHNCNAENEDPRCVCSAKLGLDFSDQDEVFHSTVEVNSTNNDTSSSFDKQSKYPTLRSPRCHQHMPVENFLENDLEPPDEVSRYRNGDHCSNGFSADVDSRRSSIDSEFLESAGHAMQCATDSGVGSSQCGGKLDYSSENCGIGNEETVHYAIGIGFHAREKDDFNCGVFSPKSSCDSEPEEWNSHQFSNGVRSKMGQCHRRTLSDSESSLSSNFSSNAYLNDLVAECERFMKQMAVKIFNQGSDITQQEKSRFGQLCQHGAGRQWFAKSVNEHRSSTYVPELVFYRLQQFFSVCLFECDHEDDYVPAKCLMLLCFVFYTDIKPPHGRHEYLFTGIRTQPIWRSLKFWNAAFFDSVHCEGMHRGSNRGHWTAETKRQLIHNRQKDSNEIFNVIVFKQLKEFTKHMYQLEVPKELNVEFLVKQSMVGQLSEAQTCSLREIIEELYNIS